MSTRSRLTLGFVALSAASALADVQTGPTDYVVDGAVRVSSDEARALIGNRLAYLHAEEYAVQRRILLDHVEQMLFRREAEKRHVTPDELERAELVDKCRPVTDAEVLAVYENAKERHGSDAISARLQIADRLRVQRLSLRRREFMSDLLARADVRIKLDPPRVAALVGAGPAIGPATAPVTIVEYSDFECPYCAVLQPTLRQLTAKYKDQIRWAFRDFPLAAHKHAAKAAEAGACAAEQGKFWEFHDVLFANQRDLSTDALRSCAREVGLESTLFEECLASGRHERSWRETVREGEANGVTGTPTLLINGRFIQGAPPLEDLAQIVAEELARSQRDVQPAANTETGRR